VLARSPALVAALVYAALALVMVGQGLLPGRTLSSSDYAWEPAPWKAERPAAVPPFGSNSEQADAVAQFQPFTRHTREALPSIPLWNPEIMGGRPLLANAQSAVFSPFSLPSYVLPFWTSLGIVAALKLWIAAFGAWALGGALGMGRAGALMAGLAFGFGLYLVTWLPWPLASVWALLPWLLLATDRVVRRPDAAGVAWLALPTGLAFLAGHPESTFHVVVAAGAFAVLRIVQRRDLRPAGAWLLGAAAGAGLAAVLLIPLLELLAHSGDVDTRGDEPPGHLPVKYVGGLLMPEYWGRPTQAVTDQFLNVRAFYVGVLPLMLAGAALLLRPTATRVAVAAFGALCLATALGVPPVFDVVNALPGFSLAHNTRLGALAVLCLALLAGWGLDDLLRRRPFGRGRALLAGAAALALVPLAWVLAAGRLADLRLGDALAIAWGFDDLPDTAEKFVLAPQVALLQFLPLGALALALLAARVTGRVGATAFAVLALALAAADLLRYGMGQNPAIPREHATQPATGAIRFLQERRPARFAGLRPSFGLPPVNANLGMDFDLDDARGYDYPVERRYDRLWRRAIAPEIPFIPPTTQADTRPSALRGLALLGARWLVQQPQDAPLRARGTRLAYDGRDARVYELPAALPRALLVDRQVVAGDALDAVLDPAFDPRRAAVVEERVPGVAPGPGRPGRVALVAREDDRLRVRVDARRPALLVMPDVHYPGWRAEVDGDEAALRRANYLLRAVAVPAGRHEVTLSYAPASFRAGWVVSLLTALALAAAVLLGRRRRRA
jgi:Bacterial membrane protein YfhO